MTLKGGKDGNRQTGKAHHRDTAGRACTRARAEGEARPQTRPHAIARYANRTEERTSLAPPAIIAGEIVAWRCWLITLGGHLRSVYMHNKWPPNGYVKGDPSATRRGVYGLKGYCAAQNIAKVLTLIHSRESIKGVALGQVKLWGDVVEHERGYRAQYGKVASLTYVTTTIDDWHKPSETMLLELRKKYNVGGKL